jgi:hypothetical protein
MKCVDLKNVFGRRYKIRADPSAGPRNIDPWYWVIPCRLGEIYPYGGELLCALVRKGRISESIRSWPELTILQDADDAVVFRFHVDNFEKVAERVGARKRRQVSSETMKRIGAGTAYRTDSVGNTQRSQATSTSETGDASRA